MTEGPIRTAKEACGVAMAHPDVIAAAVSDHPLATGKANLAVKVRARTSVAKVAEELRVQFEKRALVGIVWEIRVLEDTGAYR